MADDKKILAAALAFIADRYEPLPEKAIITWRVEGDYVVVIANRGIKGAPKYVIPLVELPPPPRSKRTAKK